MEKKKVFSPKCASDKNRELVTVYDEELGNVTYGHLSVEDMFELNKVKEPVEHSILMCYLMLKKADPKLSIPDIEGLPLPVCTRLLRILNKDASMGLPVTQEGKL